MTFINKVGTVLLLFVTLTCNVFAEETIKKVIPKFIDGTVRVTAEEILELVEEHEDLVFFDSRTKTDFLKGYIEGSIKLSSSDIYGTSLSMYTRNTKTPIIFYCGDETCEQSVKSAKIATAEGYSNVYWFRGGIKEWINKGLPLVTP